MSKIQRFERNSSGRDLIVGDIHGCFTKLQAALDAIAFDPARDRMFSVGDLVDRGPESDLALEWLARPWFFAVTGNHEDMAIRWPRGNMSPSNYIQNGGAWNIGNPVDVQREFSEAFDALPLAMEIATAGGVVGVVHADCPFDSWTDFTEVIESELLSAATRSAIFEAAQWSRERINATDRSGVQGVHAVVVGHTPMEVSAVLGNVHYIDTMGWRNGFFTILNAETLLPEPKHV